MLVGDGDMVAGIKTDQVGLVAVVVVEIAPVVIPFLQVATPTYRIGVQPLQGMCQLLAQGRVDIQDLGGTEGVEEQLADDGQVGGAAITGHAMIAGTVHILVLGRRARCSDELLGMMGIGDEP